MRDRSGTCDSRQAWRAYRIGLLSDATFRAALSLAVVAAIAGAVVVGASKGAEVQTSRVIDRTVLCEAGLQGGIREVETFAASASGSGSRRNVGYACLNTNLPTPRLAGLWQTAAELSPACRSVRSVVGLNARGLVGGSVATIPESVDCSTPRRVLVRLRVVFGRPARLRRTNQFGFPMLLARGAVREGAIAVRAQNGKSLVLARLLRSGKVQVFAAIPESCIPD